MLERGRVGPHAGDVHSALVRERVASDVRCVGVGGEVEELVDEARGLAQRRELRLGQALVAELELQARDDRDEVGVAAALAVAVDRPLHVGRAGLDRRERVGHPTAGVVVTVGPDLDADVSERTCHLERRGGNAVRERSPVGVAAGHGLRSRLGRDHQALERIPRVVGIAVEEVLGVVDDALASCDEERDRIGDHAQVLLAIDPDHLLEVQGPRLTDEHDDRGEAPGQDPQSRVLLGTGVPPAGHPEGRDVGVLEALGREQREELELLRVRFGEPGLDHVDPELVEAVGDAELLLRRERHALPLHAVAERGVEELDRGHVRLVLSVRWRANSRAVSDARRPPP